MMTLRAYERLGGVGGALAKSADAILQGLAPDDRARAKRLLLRLVTIGRGVEPTRQAVSRGEALSAAGGGPESERVLSRLSGGRAGDDTGSSDAAARLVVVVGEPGKERVDLVHEALIQRWDTLRAWIKEARDALELRDDVEEAARIWEASGAAQDALPRGTLLGRFKGVERAGLREGARRYIEKAESLEEQAEAERGKREAESQRAVQAKVQARKRARIRNWVLVFLVPAAVAVIVWQVTKSRHSEEVAEARRLVLEARSADLPGGRTVELLLLVEAWGVAQKSGRPFFPEVEQALGDAARSEDAEYYRYFQDGRVFAVSPALGALLLAHAAEGWVVPLAGDQRVPLTGHRAPIVSAEFHADSRRVVTASADHTARVWGAADPGDPTVLSGHEGRLTAATFSADGQRIATASEDRTARIWRAQGGPALAVLAGHTDAVLDVAFSPDGARVATASADSTVRVWSADGSGEPLVLSGHEGKVLSVRFSPDGKRIATGSEDKTARIQSADGAGRALVLRHDDEVRSVRFSPDGLRLATTSASSFGVRIWDAAAAGAPVALGHAADRAVFAEDGKRLFSAAPNGTVCGWTVDAAELARSACAQAGRNFTLDEWRTFFDDAPYRATCPQWPAPAAAPASGSARRPSAPAIVTALPAPPGLPADPPDPRASTPPTAPHRGSPVPPIVTASPTTLAPAPDASPGHTADPPR